MGEAMKKIESKFNESFSYWEIRLPPHDIEQRKRGKIVEAGWAIWYLFGSDAKGEFLDYYASHRMTSDSHVRVYADGSSENFPTMSGICACSQDPTENARLEAQYYAENQRVGKLLEEKGFGLEGDEPGGVQINRLLHMKKFDE